MLDLQHVLGVLFSAVREVVAAGEDGVVGHQALGVHEVVHRSRLVWRGTLGPPTDPRTHGLPGLQLPGRLRERSPLALDLVHLGGVVAAGDVEPRAAHGLRQAGQDRARGQDRRADADAAARRRHPLSDLVHQLLRAAGREVGAHPQAAWQIPPGRWLVAGALHRAVAPELFEVLAEGGRDAFVVEPHDHVLLAGPAVGGPVGRAGPDGGAVSHDVLVVHEVGHAGDRPALRREAAQVVVIHEPGRRQQRVLGVLLVVEEADRDPPRRGAVQGAPHPLTRGGSQLQVVDRDLEGARRTVQKTGQDRCDLLGALIAVAQEVRRQRRRHRLYWASALKGAGSTSGRALVATSAASSGSSVTWMRVRSSSETIPCSSAFVRSQLSRRVQYWIPKSTIGKWSIFPVCARVTASKSSSRVPNPPGKMTKPRAYLTNIIFRTKKWRNSIPTPTRSLSACSLGSSMLQPTESPPASRQPRLMASIMPGPPPVMTATPRLARAAPTCIPMRYIGWSGRVRAEPKQVTAVPTSESASKPSTNSAMNRSTRQESVRWSCATIDWGCRSALSAGGRPLGMTVAPARRRSPMGHLAYRG